MLWKRLLSGILGIIILLAVVFSGSFPFFIVSLLLAGVGAVEYYRLLPFAGDDNQLLLPLLVIIMLSILYFVPGENKFTAAALFLFLVFIYFFLKQIKNQGYNDILLKLGSKIFGLIYLSGGIYFFILLRDFAISPLEETKALWLVIVATWMTDTGAYFVGRFWGKKPLAPSISPNKTVAGGLGGLILSIIAFSIFVYLIGTFNLILLLSAPIISLAAMLGDLFISCLKRDAGVKDAGNIIPGHGGVLDRFDSMLFSAPAAYFIFYFLLL